MPTFVASRLSKNNTVFPDRIEIDTVNVTLYKGALIGFNTITIARRNLASIRVGAGLLFVDIILESFGGSVMRAHGFSRRDAHEIVVLLT